MSSPLRIDTDTIREVGNLLGQFANWHSRTFSRPEPDGSQSGEDAVLAEYLQDANGFYVDVGAGEPVSCSNTWQFYKRGWRGLLIEPRKDAVYDLAMFRPGDHIYPVAASNDNGWAQLRLHGSVSSLQGDWNISEQARSFCRTETLGSILAKFPAIRDGCQLCSLDVEGHERQALEGIDWETFHPKVFVIEYAIYGASGERADSTDQWEHILHDKGYHRRHTTALNRIYERD